MNFVWTFHGGKQTQSITSITLVAATAKTQDITIPTGKRWKIKSINIMNPDTAARNINIYIYKESGKTNLLEILRNPISVSAGGNVIWPSYSTSPAESAWWHDIILSNGNTISITWSAGAGAGGGPDADGLVITYEEIDI